MRSTRRRVGIVAAWTVAATLGLGAVAGAASSIAFAAPTPSPSTTAASPAPSASPGAKDRREARKARRPAAARALHGEAVVAKKGGGYQTVVRQRGEVTAVDADSVTLRSKDGYTATYVVNADTKVRVDRKKGAISGVAKGDTAVVIGVRAGDVRTARGLAAGDLGRD